MRTLVDQHGRLMPSWFKVGADVRYDPSIFALTMGSRSLRSAGERVRIVEIVRKRFLFYTTRTGYDSYRFEWSEVWDFTPTPTLWDRLVTLDESR